MPLRITIDVFSGRPNPVIELDDREATEVAERLRPARRLEEGEGELPPEPILGYRGVVIEQVGDALVAELPRVTRLVGTTLFGRGLAHRPADEGVEEFICGSTGPFRRVDLQDDFFDRLGGERERLREVRGKLPWPVPLPWPWLRRCRCGPVYEPTWWNVPSRQPFNNCYNYATNYRSDTFAQPGLAAGAMYTALTCAAVLPAAVADELVDTPNADNACPVNGHLVALVVAPGWDFHWYRKGRDGLWTHKPGSTPVTNVDNSGVLIPDPRNADRGPYTDFCTFMIVLHGHIKLA
jgi:hypothetical protein